MNRTLKKAVAAILAVLMVVFSLPFTAFAMYTDKEGNTYDTGDYNVDVRLQFGVINDYSCATTWNDSTMEMASKKSQLWYGASSLYEVPLTYDYTWTKNSKGYYRTSGNLVLTSEMQQASLDNVTHGSSWEVEEAGEDYTYTTGDVFTVSVTLNNIVGCNATEAIIEYSSDSIEPVGLVCNDDEEYEWMTTEEADAAGYSFEDILRDSDAASSLSQFSSGDMYGYNAGSECSEIATDISSIHLQVAPENDSAIYYGCTASETDNYNAKQSSTFINPEDGSKDYNYKNILVASTFVFRIKDGTKPIQFGIYDPTNGKDGYYNFYSTFSDATQKITNTFRNGTYVASSTESQPYKQTTYSYDNYDENNKITGDDAWSGGTETAGSKHMTFMGINKYDEEAGFTSETTTTYTVTYVDAAGNTVATNTVDEGSTDANVPTTNTATTYTKGEGTHTKTVYSWPEAEAITADTTINEVATETSEACTYSSEETKAATYTSAGETTYTCDLCGYSYVDYTTPAMLTCDHPTEYQTTGVNAKDATLVSKGYTGDTYCSQCETTIETGTETDMLVGTDYYTALAAAQAVNNDDGTYTAASYEALQTAISTYSQATVEAYTSQADVDAATEALNAAVAALVAADVTYTYTYADGSTTQVTAAAGETPTAPANTADVVTKSTDGVNHTVTSYSWTSTGDTTFAETGADTTEACTITTTTVGATINAAGSTTTTCSVCGYENVEPIAQLDGSAYTAALAAAQAVDNTNGTYTTDSYAAVTDAIATYSADVVGAYTTQAEVDAAAAALTAAVNGLVKADVTYTYTYADGSTTQVTAAAGVTPTAPANTADKITTSTDGVNHTVTSYSWTSTGDTTFAETGADTTEACTITTSTVGATITAAGSTTTTCSVCGYENVEAIDILDGEAYYAALAAATAVDGSAYTAESYAALTEALATYDKTVVEAYTSQADVDAAAAAINDAVAALVAKTMVDITVDTSAANADLGTAYINDDAVTGTSKTVSVEQYSQVTLKAVPADDTVEFVGWTVNNKIVSEDAEYTTYAVSDTTYVPVYAEKTAETFSVIFVDSYGNVISSQNVSSGADVTIPDVPARVGYTATGWSMSDEEIAALTSGATITAVYTKDAAATKYTVTTDADVTITANGNEATGKMTDLDYDTKVTLYKEGATAWTVDGVKVGYGDTYIFYIGSDITVTPVTDAVDKTPEVVAVEMTKLSSGAVAFLSTRTIPDGYTLVNAGYVYGKNMNDADLTLEMVGKTGTGTNSGTVKVKYASTDSEQFQLNYGIKTPSTGDKVSARAFITCKNDATGEITTNYATVQTYTYA